MKIKIDGFELVQSFEEHYEYLVKFGEEVKKYIDSNNSLAAELSQSLNANNSLELLKTLLNSPSDLPELAGTLCEVEQNFLINNIIPSYIYIPDIFAHLSTPQYANQVWSCYLHGVYMHLSEGLNSSELSNKVRELIKTKDIEYVDVRNFALVIPSLLSGMSFSKSLNPLNLIGFCVYLLKSHNSNEQSFFMPSMTNLLGQHRYKLVLQNISSAIDFLESENQDLDVKFELAKGYVSAKTLFHELLNNLRGVFNLRGSVHELRMLDVLKKTHKFGAPYHQNVKTKECPLSQIMEEGPESFIQFLESSAYIRKGKPEKSPLTNKLVAFKGPMFRVFCKTELEIINTWITKTPEFSNSEHVDFTIETSFPISFEFAPTNEKRAFKEIEFRRLFNSLVNNRYEDNYDEVLFFVDKWFRLSELQLRGNTNLPSFSYDRYSIDKWYETHVNNELLSYVPVDSLEEIPTRQDVVDDAVAILPMILADGGWIYNWLREGFSGLSFTNTIRAIYSDEIGNGEFELNHHNIYKDLINEMGYQFDDFKSIEFANDCRFDEGSFYIPCLWLGMAMYPRRYLPETLGLNLAMELSGVGSTYRTAKELMERYGFSTLFVDLHNTIDNTASGHAAMAYEAIVKFMEETKTNNSMKVDETWKRILIGFNALSAEVWNRKTIKKLQHRKPLSFVQKYLGVYS
ncbi:hypothetical protein A3712_22150 [Vibrio sp. HI00D65]|uniref:iron-containing redox enzyme family protein n=1 Tax=Vibrio sp. HI00D65 TaxID=1822216 RepID=UPI0007B9387F|nr:iron-containing redox enzyme family protein [Vibrio sp. HI00D65]KZX62452.1 hypothetical protein A3712_22150 [Vibrio sp. HI00D65]